MTPEQREELKQAALKATPGPWKKGSGFTVGPVSQDDDQSYGMVISLADVYGDNREADSKFIRTANPAAILSLIAQVEALTVPQWISVQDRLPDPGMCIAFSNWGVRSAYRHDPQWAGGCFQDSMESADEGMYGNGPGPYKVTHWMPLPAAPTIPAIPGTKEGT